MVRVAIVGAGINGLSCALALQQHGVTDIHIFAEKFSPDTTSDGAGAVWRPVYLADTPAERARRWSADTFEVLMEMVKSGEGAGAGVSLCSGYELFASDEERPFWADIVVGFRNVDNAEIEQVFGRSVAKRTKQAWFYTSIMMEGPLLLPWMMGRLQATGQMTLWNAKVESLAGLLERRESGDGAATRMSGAGALGPSFDFVVNCAGLQGGLQLADDSRTYPARGQTAYLDAPWQKTFLFAHDTVAPGALVYVLPRFGKVVIGGTYEKNEHDDRVREADKRKILENAFQVLPGLKQAKEVGSWAGLRPCRSAVRLEPDTSNYRIVHNYGHGGSGMTLFAGCAQEVASFVTPQAKFHAKL